MVSTVTRANRRLDPPSIISDSEGHGILRKNPNQHILEVRRFSNRREQLEALGIEGLALELLVNKKNLEKSSENTYKSAVKRWKDYCVRKHVNPHQR